MTTQLSTINFHNQSLITFEQDGIFYTAMKPICENIGLAWHSQYERIKRDEVLSQGILIIRTPTNGGDQQMICLPIDYLNGWLFGIDVKRCKPEIRELLITYKKECYKALADYWMKGKAERQPDLPLVDPMQEIISREMPVEHWLHLASLWFRLYDCVDTLDKLKDPLEKLGSKYAPHVYSCATEDKITLGILKRILEPVLEGIEAPEYERHYRKALEFLRNYKPSCVGAIAVI